MQLNHELFCNINVLQGAGDSTEEGAQQETAAGGQAPRAAQQVGGAARAGVESGNISSCIGLGL